MRDTSITAVQMHAAEGSSGKSVMPIPMLASVSRCGSMASISMAASIIKSAAPTANGESEASVLLSYDMVFTSLI